MDELKNFLDQFDVQEVKTSQEMLRLPKDTQVDADKLLKYSVSYNYDPNKVAESQKVAEKLIIDELKKRLKVLGVDKLPSKYRSLIGLNILHPFIYDNIGIQQPVRLVWTGYFYLEFNPAILRSDNYYINYYIRREQLDTMLALKGNLTSLYTGHPQGAVVDIVPFLNRQIGKTTMLIDWAIKQAKCHPEVQYIYIVPTHLQKSPIINKIKKLVSLSENSNLVVVAGVKEAEDVCDSEQYNDVNFIVDELQGDLSDYLPNEAGYTTTGNIDFSKAHYTSEDKAIEIPLDIQDS